MSPKITFFVDFDNTLLNNDHLKEKLRNILNKTFRQDVRRDFDRIYKQIKKEKGFVDLPELMKRITQKTKATSDITTNSIIKRINFKDCLFNQSEKVIEHLQKFGKVVIVSEGEKYYQTIKIKKSGIWNKVKGCVELPLKKKAEYLPTLFEKYPAKIYYLIEDKPEILKQVASLHQGRIKTIHVCQGHYSTICREGLFDLKISSIEKLLKINFPLQT